MSRWVDVPVRALGTGDVPADPMVVVAALKERDRERALALLEEMDYAAWVDRMMEIGALQDQWALSQESMDEGENAG